METFIWNVIKIILITAPLMLAVAYLTLAERRIIAFIQSRLGPNRVGPWGLLQPIADGLKLLLKEIILPSRSSKIIYLIAPILAIAPALAAWAVIPFAQNLQLVKMNVGLLYLLALSSLGVYGLIFAGWASNSRYAFLGAMRSAAQMIAYEIPMAFALLGVVILAKSLELQTIVEAQSGGFWQWFFIPLFPLFVIYWICVLAETNRSPFDVAEGESEVVAGHHVEYAGMSFAIFFLAEYANMILLSVLASILFLGGYLAPIDSLNWIPGMVWLFMKTSVLLFSFLWFRATLPRYRYDQIMRLGWKVFIPITFLWVVALGFYLVLSQGAGHV